METKEVIVIIDGEIVKLSIPVDYDEKLIGADDIKWDGDIVVLDQ